MAAVLPGAPWVPLTCGALPAGFVHCVVRIHFFWDATVQLGGNLAGGTRETAPSTPEGEMGSSAPGCHRAASTFQQLTAERVWKKANVSVCCVLKCDELQGLFLKYFSGIWKRKLLSF